MYSSCFFISNFLIASCALTKLLQYSCAGLKLKFCILHVSKESNFSSHKITFIILIKLRIKARVLVSIRTIVSSFK